MTSDFDGRKVRYLGIKQFIYLVRVLEIVFFYKIMLS